MKESKVFGAVTVPADGKLQMNKVGMCKMEARAQE